MFEFSFEFKTNYFPRTAPEQKHPFWYIKNIKKWFKTRINKLWIIDVSSHDQCVTEISENHDIC